MITTKDMEEKDTLSFIRQEEKTNQEQNLTKEDVSHSDIHAQIEEQIISHISEVEQAAQTSEDAIMPEIKGLEILKEGTYAVDLENTISNMLGIIKKMEAQLERVLKLNAKLEKDLDTSKEMVNNLLAEKKELLVIINKMKEEIPFKRELQIEIDHLIDERNRAQRSIHELKTKLEQISKNANDFQKKNISFQKEKTDDRLEIEYLNSKVKKFTLQLLDFEQETTDLKQENLTLSEKIKTKEKELNQAYDEKYKMYRELKQLKKM
ncbi:Mad25 [Candidatus Magnetomoraceae bacterium gMMP-1]